jgi:pseudo-response regulator 1
MVGAGGSGAAVAGGQQFVDRSKVRILLCDGGSNSSSEVLRLLCNCSYQGQLTFTALPYLVASLHVILPHLGWRSLLSVDSIICRSTGVSGWNDVYACSYPFSSFFDPVTCAKSPRQVINILNYEGGEIDIILAEVDLPVSKCFKMLKYIARNKDLRHIPIISKLPHCCLCACYQVPTTVSYVY